MIYYAVVSIFANFIQTSSNNYQKSTKLTNLDFQSLPAAW